MTKENLINRCHKRFFSKSFQSIRLKTQRYRDFWELLQIPGSFYLLLNFSRTCNWTQGFVNSYVQIVPWVSRGQLHFLETIPPFPDLAGSYQVTPGSASGSGLQSVCTLPIVFREVLRNVRRLRAVLWKKTTTRCLELDSEDIAFWCYLRVSDTGFSRLFSL